MGERENSYALDHMRKDSSNRGLSTMSN